ncbi:MAG: SDR family NAD(P)-dependent oxidoreductase [Pirellulales bacterium]|nr:SDR family NAD(P)-dependent oxidoreductase [Pirellulales bacterium]
MIGWSCRFPGAADIDAFWQLLCQGQSGVGPMTEDRARAIPRTELIANAPLAMGGYLGEVDQFDPAFFKISPHEARLMDPQQRLFLEVAWETIETAGYRPEQLAATRCGVFVGVNANEYGTLLSLSGESDAHLQSGNAVSLVATRVSYLLDLQGPSLTVDTACSSSLVALHLACQSLLTGDCRTALVGGVNLMLNPLGTEMVERFGMLAADGRVKAFDDRADGFVRGEGVGAILLKPLANALADRDPILAVIRSTAVNNDGHAKAGLAAPNPKSQQAVICDAYRKAGVKPRQIGLLEAHGTGTALGDPIEVDALRQAFAEQPGGRAFCALGSAKTNIGHLESAAGMAGLIKALLAVRHGLLPPTLHVDSPNRHIAFEASPFYINDRLRPWPTTHEPRRAGVSAFGFGGTNVHVVVEQATEDRTSVSGQGGPHDDLSADAEPSVAHVLTLSARSDTALRHLAERYLQRLSGDEAWTLGDVCLTSNLGRVMHNRRLAIVARYRDQLLDKLRVCSLSPRWDDLAGSLIFVSPTAVAPSSQAPIANQQSATTGIALLQGEARVTALAALAEQWAQGREIDWAAVQRDPPYQRVELPTYPFERQRYWLRERTNDAEPQARQRDTVRGTVAPAHGATATQRPSPAEAPIQPATEVPVEPARLENWLFQPAWVREDRAATPLVQGGAELTGKWLVFVDDLGVGTEIARRLRGSGAQVIEIRRGAVFRRVSDGELELNPDAIDGYRALWRAAGKHVAGVVHLWCLNAEGGDVGSMFELSARLSDGVRSLHLLWKTWSARRLARLMVVTDRSQQARDEDRVAYPEQAAAFGLIGSLAQEEPSCRLAAIDLDLAHDSVEQAGAVILSELAAQGTQASPIQVAYHGDARWVAGWRPLDFAAWSRRPHALRQGGVYLITGGLGGIGLELARWLHTHYRAKVVLLGRTKLPARKSWEASLRRRSPHDVVARRLRELLALEADGAEVWPVAGDVADIEEMTDLVARVKERYGALHGILHAAGTTRDGLLATLSAKDIEEVLRGKIQGAWALDQATRHEQLDWMVLFSSVASWWGGPGQAPYAAANRCLDAFAVWRTGAGRPTMSINWGLWGETGMAVPHVERVRRSGTLEPMRTGDALAAFQRALQLDCPQVVIAALGPQGKHLLSAAPQAVEPAGGQAAPLPPRPSLASPDEVERHLAERLARLLEVAQAALDRQQSFADLGLDSILVVQLTRELETLVGHALPFNTLQQYPNLETLSEFLYRELTGPAHAR